MFIEWYIVLPPKADFSWFRFVKVARLKLTADTLVYLKNSNKNNNTTIHVPYITSKSEVQDDDG